MNPSDDSPLQTQLIGTDPQDRLAFEFLGWESYDFSLNLTIRAEQSGCGAKRSPWFGAREIDSFCSDLRECERTRRGEARLEALLPTDFSLRLWNTRSKGDFALCYGIGQGPRSAENIPIRLEGGFALEPGLLARFVADFEVLAHRRFVLE